MLVDGRLISSDTSSTNVFLFATSRPARVPLDAFEAGLSKAIGPDAGREIAALYRWFNTDGATCLSPGKGGTAALGVTPTQMRDWAARVPWEQIAG